MAPAVIKFSVPYVTILLLFGACAGSDTALPRSNNITSTFQQILQRDRRAVRDLECQNDYDDVSPLQSNNIPEPYCTNQLVSDKCLDCICQTTGGYLSRSCRFSSCGPFRIQYAYWDEAGRHTIDGQPFVDPQAAYRLCTNNIFCATRTVQSYMRKFAKDCNGDNSIDCYDFMTIHMKGRHDCTDTLHSSYKYQIAQCYSSVN